MLTLALTSRRGKGNGSTGAGASPGYRVYISGLQLGAHQTKGLSLESEYCMSFREKQLEF